MVVPVLYHFIGARSSGRGARIRKAQQISHHFASPADEL
jgi:hypothetical protein